MAVIETKRFTLRPFRRSDAAATARNINNRKIAAAVADIPYPYREKDAREFIEICIRQYRRKRPEGYVFAIEIDGEVAGGIGFMNIEEHGADVGYWLAEQHWGKGIMPHALRLASRWSFQQFGIIRVQARVFVFNRRSARVLEKAGFKREGLMRKVFVRNGKPLDMYLYAKVR